jgi:hypothetical protein
MSGSPQIGHNGFGPRQPPWTETLQKRRDTRSKQWKRARGLDRRYRCVQIRPGKMRPPGPDRGGLLFQRSALKLLSRRVRGTLSGAPVPANTWTAERLPLTGRYGAALSRRERVTWCSSMGWEGRRQTRKLREAVKQRRGRGSGWVLDPPLQRNRPRCRGEFKTRSVRRREERKETAEACEAVKQSPDCGRRSKAYLLHPAMKHVKHMKRFSRSL